MLRHTQQVRSPDSRPLLAGFTLTAEELFCHEERGSRFLRNIAEDVNSEY
jgi:hypothetical protein